LIVSLLDIHAVPPTDGNGDKVEPLEILEAGTGHGSLTLYLARAIQAANTNPPPIPQTSQVRVLEERPSSSGEQPQEENPISDKDDVPVAQKDWDEWRAQRRAVIHTIDVSAKFSTHAEQTVRGFRRGMYAGNVDFHVGAVENWIKDQVQRRKTPSGVFSWRGTDTLQPFLSYAILDMPSAHLRIPHVAPVLRRDGLLAVFMPSITQIGECVQLIQKEKLPFAMERVVELGMGMSSGRLWDVRMAVRKSRADPNTWTEARSSSEDEGETQTEKEETDSESTPVPEEDNVLVCRPKVGSRIVGGGFVGIWRRIEDAPKKRS
jgi:tRNA A58 N-methylase Trm61